MRKLIKALAKDIHRKIKQTLLICDLGSEKLLYKPSIFFSSRFKICLLSFTFSLSIISLFGISRA